MARSDLVQSLQRALDILEGVAGADEGLRLGEIAGRTGLKKPTAHNLARTLSARGYLAQDADQRYRPGPMIEELVHRCYRRGILRRAESEMLRLQRRLGQAVITFSELVGTEIHCRLRLAPELPGVLRRSSGPTFAAFGSASGLCLQAFNPGFREAVSGSGSFEESGRRLWPVRSDFEQALVETARRGAAVIETRSGSRLAAPVGDHFTLGMSVGPDASAFEDVLARLMEAATAVAEERTGRGEETP